MSAATVISALITYPNARPEIECLFRSDEVTQQRRDIAEALTSAVFVEIETNDRALAFENDVLLNMSANASTQIVNSTFVASTHIIEGLIEARRRLKELLGSGATVTLFAATE